MVHLQFDNIGVSLTGSVLHYRLLGQFDLRPLRLDFSPQYCVAFSHTLPSRSRRCTPLPGGPISIAHPTVASMRALHDYIFFCEGSNMVSLI